MDINDMFEYYGYRSIDLATMSKDDQLHMWSIFAYWQERTETIIHSNFTEHEFDVAMRRRDKKTCRSIEDVIEGDYGLL